MITVFYNFRIALLVVFTIMPFSVLFATETPIITTLTETPQLIATTPDAVAPSQNTSKNAVVDVTSDSLWVDQSKNQAKFEGHVVITREELTLKAEKVAVQLESDGKKMKEIVATGGVKMQNGENIGAGETAVFLPETQEITLKGDVQLLRDGSSLSGDTLIYDLNSGRMKLSAPTTNDEETGRVRARFTLKNKEDKE